MKGDGEKETLIGFLLHAPYRGLSQQLRHVPWNLTSNLWSMGRHSAN